MLKLTRVCREENASTFRVDILLMTQQTPMLTARGLVYPRYQLIEEIPNIPTYKAALGISRWIEKNDIRQLAVDIAKTKVAERLGE